jgi:hypothetical protein
LVGVLFLGLKPQATCLHPFGVGFRDTLLSPLPSGREGGWEREGWESEGRSEGAAFLPAHAAQTDAFFAQVLSAKRVLKAWPVSASAPASPVALYFETPAQ